jgi:transcriptional regulator of met regulon
MSTRSDAVRDIILQFQNIVPNVDEKYHRQIENLVHATASTLYVVKNTAPPLKGESAQPVPMTFGSHSYLKVDNP